MPRLARVHCPDDRYRVRASSRWPSKLSRSLVWLCSPGAQRGNTTKARHKSPCVSATTRGHVAFQESYKWVAKRCCLKTISPEQAELIKDARAESIVALPA